MGLHSAIKGEELPKPAATCAECTDGHAEQRGGQSQRVCDPISTTSRTRKAAAMGCGSGLAGGPGWDRAEGSGPGESDARGRPPRWTFCVSATSVSVSRGLYCSATLGGTK